MFPYLIGPEMGLLVGIGNKQSEMHKSVWSHINDVIIAKTIELETFSGVKLTENLHAVIHWSVFFTKYSGSNLTHFFHKRNLV